MTAYHTICGKTINKSTRADTTGNRDTEACAGCPHLLPWGGEFDFETHSFGGYKGYECRMPQSEIRYETEFAGSVNDKCTCRVSSLDFDFLALISTWIKETYPDGELSGALSMDKRRGADYVSAGRFCLSIYCAQNKKGMAAKAALRQRFFDDRGKRLDLSPDDEREKVLADIRRGIESHKQNSENSEQTNGFVDSVDGGENIRLSEQAKAAIEELFMEDEKKVTIYRDPATGWLYRVSPEPVNGEYCVQYLDEKTSAIWKSNFTKPTGETPGAAEYWLSCQHFEVVDEQPRDDANPTEEAPDDVPEVNLATTGGSTLPAFDYVGLDPQTVATLHSAEAMITDARQGYIVKMADAVGMAHDELVANCEGHNQHSEETFVAWCKSVGLKKDTAYRLLQVSNLISASSPVEQSVLEQASPSLLYAAAKPSAPAELVQGVKDGNITTHKQYKELEAQLKAEQAAREKAEKDAAYFRADSEQARAAAHEFHTKAETAESKLNQTIDQQAEYAAKVTEAEHKAREAQKELAGAKQALEAVKMRADRWQKEAEEAKQQPIETTVVDQSEVERRAAELAAEQTATLKRQIADLQAAVSSTTSEDDQHYAYDAVILACRIFDSAWQTARGQWGKIPPNLRQAARDMINKKLNDIREDLQCL